MKTFYDFLIEQDAPKPGILIPDQQQQGQQQQLPAIFQNLPDKFNRQQIVQKFHEAYIQAKEATANFKFLGMEIYKKNYINPKDAQQVANMLQQPENIIEKTYQYLGKLGITR